MGQILVDKGRYEAVNELDLLNERIQALNISADKATTEKLLAYHALLADWNTRMNLTGDTDFSACLDRHYADSLAPLALGLFPANASLIDVGSGAGFPGIPLAIARPDLKITLLDSLQKRITFLSAVVEALDLKNVQLIHARAEDGGRMPTLREQFDLAVARAVAPLPVLCELLLPFIKVGGSMICYKGPAAEEELAIGNRASHLAGGDPLKVLPVVLPSQPEWHHCVVTAKKICQTARLYPRKAGLPEKNPLGTPIVKA